jgi:ribonuclease D
MTPITETDDLAAHCKAFAKADFLTVDTEFMRDRTYWPKLCLVQIASADEAVAVDPLAPDIDLAPLFSLLNDKRVLKVFHAARQDMEIFFHLTGRIPKPVFDTQVAAMVCGFAESVGYETLVTRLAGAKLDKASRFADWANRPLRRRQLEYALADVTHLRTVYQKLQAKLDQNGRTHWLAEEMEKLTDPKTYQAHPEDAWQRLKYRSTNPRFLGVLRAVAAWRESVAQSRDVPRNRVMRDDSLFDVAAHAPADAAELAQCRGISKGLANGDTGAELLAAIAAAKALPDKALPQAPQRPEPAPGVGPIAELLKVLLKRNCEDHHVAQKLVASSRDVELIASDDDAPVPALHGWRRELFGEDALALKHGKLALTADGKRVEVMHLGK